MSDVERLLTGMRSSERIEVLRRARHLQTMRDADANARLDGLDANQREHVRALMSLPHEALRQAENDAQCEQEPWNP